MLLICLAAGALTFLLYQVLALTHPYPLDYGEAPLVDQAMRLFQGQNIYRPNLAAPPYTISNYPPLYVLALTPFVKLFGPGFGMGRTISLLCSLASAAFLALIVFTLTTDRTAAIITGLLFLALPYVVYWSGLSRIDLLALACSTGGLLLLVRWPDARWSLVAAGLCLVAAIYTRQSYALAAPVAAFFWLWIRDRRRAIGLAVLVGGLALTLFLALNVITRGGFYFNIVTANVNDFGTGRLEWNLRRLRDATCGLLLLGGAFLIVAPGRLRGWTLLVPYLIGAAFSGLTIGKIGSNVNYFLELCAALSLIAGALIAWGRERRWLRIVLMVFLTFQVAHLMQTTLKDYAGGLSARRGSVDQLRQLEELMGAVNGPVLADEYMGMITLHRRPLYLQPFEVTQLARAGVWDQTPLVESIRNREFPLILIHYFSEYPVYKERWTAEMLLAIQRYYVPEESLADTRVYRPRIDFFCIRQQKAPPQQMVARGP
jgi:4-amino-4-deoxy-L-arabinose transferase-like glycosyltransferase